MMASDQKVPESRICLESTPLLKQGQRQRQQRLQRICGRQSSVITVLALWNTMIATSVLSLPWAVKQAGLLLGVLWLIAVAAIMGYTCYLVLHSVDIFVDGQMLEFQDVCRRCLGRWAKVLAMSGSVLSLVGGMVVFWLLITSFLFHIGHFLYNRVHGVNETWFNSSTEEYDYAVCGAGHSMSHQLNGSDNTSSSSSRGDDNSCIQFHQLWSQTGTIPFFLLVLLFPLLNFRKSTVFTLMNSVGMLSLVYLVVFVAMKAVSWGWNLDPGVSLPERDLYHSHYAPQFRLSFPALTGVASLGYFVQSSVLSLVRNQRHPQHNTRDLFVAYFLVAVTYIYVGGVFYVSYPLNKSCIADNLLDNIASEDMLGLVARAGLCFQLTCLFPQLAFITRIQLFTAFFRSSWPSVYHVVVLNVLLVTICVLFAVFLPHIGRIISFVGALCGFYYAIGLPCLVRCMVLRQEGRLTCFHIVLHVLLNLLAFLNVLAQFFSLEE